MAHDFISLTKLLKSPVSVAPDFISLMKLLKGPVSVQTVLTVVLQGPSSPTPAMWKWSVASKSTGFGARSWAVLGTVALSDGLASLSFRLLISLWVVAEE